MVTNNKISAYKAVLSQHDFEHIKKYMEGHYGIKLPLQKKVMVQGRLQKRLAELGINSFNEYINSVFNNPDNPTELYNMIDALTTNKTSFFREAAHFDYIQNIVVPKFVKNHTFKTLKAWSAGCSSGEEVYTLAMILQEKLIPQKFGYSIWGSDISIKMLKKARTAIYDDSLAETVPNYLKKKYILKSKDATKKLVRVSQELRSHTLFGRLNFMDQYYQTPYTFDIVMLRNVIIYFDKEQQMEVIRKIVEKMNKGGYLFLGHSETILNNHFPLESVGPTIYRKISKPKKYVKRSY